jgi:hypothetical protein
VEDGKFLFTRNVEEQQNKLVSRSVAGSWESFVSCKGMLRGELRFNIGVSRPAEAVRLYTQDRRTGSVCAASLVAVSLEAHMEIYASPCKQACTSCFVKVWQFLDQLNDCQFHNKVSACDFNLGCCVVELQGAISC